MTSHLTDTHTNTQQDTHSMMGKHILAEFWQCQCPMDLLTKAEPLLSMLIKRVDAVGLTLVGKAVHEFDGSVPGNEHLHAPLQQSGSPSLSNLSRLNPSTSDIQTDNLSVDKLSALSATKQSDVRQGDVKQSGAKEQGCGVTLSLLLAESHLCLHTWGEYQTVTLDVYVCNVLNDNSLKAEALFNACLDIFQPKSHHVSVVSRCHSRQASCNTFSEK